MPLLSYVSSEIMVASTERYAVGAIVSLSLAGGCVMEMRKGDEKRAIYLPARSLVIMAGPSRYEWQHYIPHRKSDKVQGITVPRSARRVSFTFRKVGTA